MLAGISPWTRHAGHRRGGRTARSPLSSRRRPTSLTMAIQPISERTRTCGGIGGIHLHVLSGQVATVTRTEAPTTRRRCQESSQNWLRHPVRSSSRHSFHSRTANRVRQHVGGICVTPWKTDRRRGAAAVPHPDSQSRSRHFLGSKQQKPPEHFLRQASRWTSVTQRSNLPVIAAQLWPQGSSSPRALESAGIAVRREARSSRKRLRIRVLGNQCAPLHDDKREYAQQYGQGQQRTRHNNRVCDTLHLAVAIEPARQRGAQGYED